MFTCYITGWQPWTVPYLPPSCRRHYKCQHLTGVAIQWTWLLYKAPATPIQLSICEFKLELLSGNAQIGAKFVLTSVTLTFCMDIASVSINYSWKFHDEQADRTIHRAAWSQLKISILLQVIRRPLGNLPLHKYVILLHSLGRVAIPDWSLAKGDTCVSKVIKGSDNCLSPLWCSHIEAETKLLPFHRRHIQMHILVSKGPINNIPSLVLIMAWRHYLNQWWLDYWCIHSSLGLRNQC